MIYKKKGMTIKKKEIGQEEKGRPVAVVGYPPHMYIDSILDMRFNDTHTSHKN